jgi:hypothetical protein
MAVLHRYHEQNKSNPHLLFGDLGIARPRIVFVLRKSGAATIAAATAKGRHRSAVSDTDRDCFLPAKFEFLSTKCRKVRRRMQRTVISPRGTVSLRA